MAHYAFLDENNKVVEVITGKGEDDTNTLPEGFDSWEDWYEDFRGLTCKRTSYNTRANTHTNGGTPFRGNYAGLGYTYDEDNDVFIPPKPYPSWTLSSNWEWEAPVNYPDSVNLHYWNENLGEWEEIT